MHGYEMEYVGGRTFRFGPFTGILKLIGADGTMDVTLASYKRDGVEQLVNDVPTEALLMFGTRELEFLNGTVEVTFTNDVKTARIGYLGLPKS